MIKTLNTPAIDKRTIDGIFPPWMSDTEILLGIVSYIKKNILFKRRQVLFPRSNNEIGVFKIISRIGADGENLRYCYFFA